MIACYDLTLSCPRGDGCLFDGVDFEIDDGEWVEFVGGPGTGKSVLFSILGGRARPTSGRLIAAGRNVDRLAGADWARMRREIGQCAQRPSLLEDRTVLENLLVPEMARGRTDGARGRAETWLSAVGAAGLADRRVRTLADHERTLVGGLRAGVGAPQLMLFDATFDGAGPWHAPLLERLVQARDAGRTIVIFGRTSTDAAPPGARELRLTGDGRVSGDKGDLDR